MAKMKILYWIIALTFFPSIGVAQNDISEAKMTIQNNYASFALTREISTLEGNYVLGGANFENSWIENWMNLQRFEMDIILNRVVSLDSLCPELDFYEIQTNYWGFVDTAKGVTHMIERSYWGSVRDLIAIVKSDSSVLFISGDFFCDPIDVIFPKGITEENVLFFISLKLYCRGSLDISDAKVVLSRKKIRISHCRLDGRKCKVIVRREFPEDFRVLIKGKLSSNGQK